MANKKHLDLLAQGVMAWNRWREEHPKIIPNLSRADLCGTNLCGTNLREVLLDGANLSGANLSRADILAANLRGANLSGANLSRANLSVANLSMANLSETNLSGADLVGATLTKATLGRANFDQALLGGVVFSDVDLSEAKCLDTAIHYGPSTISIDTIYRSQGKIPEAFLRGCGVPDNFIAYIGSLVGTAIEYYSCFISYSGKDELFTQRLNSRLRDEHVRVWYAPHDIQGGKKIHEQIDQAIRIHDKLLLVLSDHSIHSEWVMTEIRKARKAEIKEGRRKLFPIRLVGFDTLRDWECFDADNGKDLAVEVHEYFIPDFSNWKDHDAFEAAFSRLLNDLRELK